MRTRTRKLLPMKMTKTRRMLRTMPRTMRLTKSPLPKQRPLLLPRPRQPLRKLRTTMRSRQPPPPNRTSASLSPFSKPKRSALGTSDGVFIDFDTLCLRARRQKKIQGPFSIAFSNRLGIFVLLIVIMSAVQ